MKQLFKTIAAFALVATISTSCSKDDSTNSTNTEVGAPTLTVIAPTAELKLRFNDVTTINYTASPASGAKLKSILITRQNLSSNVTIKLYGDSTAALGDSSTINRTFKDSVLNTIGNVGDRFTYTITLTDNKGKYTVKTVSLLIQDLYLSGQFTVGADANKTILEKFFGLNENVSKTVAFFKAGVATMGASHDDSLTRARFFSNAKNIDVLFFYGASLSGFYSPNHPFGAGNGWATEITFWTTPLNNTIFITNPVDNQNTAVDLNSSIFSATNYNVEKTIDAIDFTQNNKTFANNLQDGGVVAFKTAKGKGLILLVKAAVDNLSYATISIKWKKN